MGNLRTAASYETKAISGYASALMKRRAALAWCSSAVVHFLQLPCTKAQSLHIDRRRRTHSLSLERILPAKLVVHEEDPNSHAI